MKQNNSGNKQSTDLILVLIGCYLSVISVKLRIAKFLLLRQVVLGVACSDSVYSDKSSSTSIP